MPNANDNSAENTAALRFITFRIDRQLLALGADDVAEVIRVPSIAAIPQSPVALLGMANLRGNVLPVVSLRGLLGIPAGAISQTSRALVIDVGGTVALVVDSVEALVTVAQNRIGTKEADLGAESNERVSGAFEVDAERGVAKIIDIKALLDAAFAQRARSQRQSRGSAATVSGRQLDTADSTAEMLVTFEVAGQEFAFGIDAVREVIPASAQRTAVPRAEALVLGMTTLRGALLPLLSLRGLLGLPPAATANLREKIVVMNVAGAAVGLVADRARAVVAAQPAQIDPIPPVLAARSGGEARIKAIYRAESARRLISILAPEQLFREDVMQRLNAARGDQATPAAEAAASQGGELIFLVFRLGDDEFGLPIETVDEVAQVPEKITRVPKTPKFLDGVINLRGDVLPVIDQRRRFEMPKLERTRGRRPLIVVRTERHRAGLIVDSVSDVLRVRADSVEPAPELTEEASRLVRGLVNLEASDRMILLLDPLELLTRAERKLLDAFQAEAARAA